jgi:hypothetical protein
VSNTTATLADQSTAALAARIRALLDSARPFTSDVLADVGEALMLAEPWVGTALPQWARTEFDVEESVARFCMAAARHRVFERAAEREKRAMRSIADEIPDSYTAARFGWPARK